MGNWYLNPNGTVAMNPDNTVPFLTQAEFEDCCCLQPYPPYPPWPDDDPIPAPCTCPCSTWPPVSWPCSDLREYYQVEGWLESPYDGQIIHTRYEYRDRNGGTPLTPNCEGAIYDWKEFKWADIRILVADPGTSCSWQISGDPLLTPPMLMRTQGDDTWRLDDYIYSETNLYLNTALCYWQLFNYSKPDLTKLTGLSPVGVYTGIRCTSSYTPDRSEYRLRVMRVREYVP